jgi:hypothetical protein
VCLADIVAAREFRKSCSLRAAVNCGFWHSLAGPDAAEMVLRRLPREVNDRSRRACSRDHERRYGVRSAIGRCPL